MDNPATADQIQDARKAPRGKKVFSQVMPRGWDTLSAISENPYAMRVYTFIAKHCDHLNALVCSVDVMAEELACSPRSIMRATKWLADRDHIVIIKIGTANAYVLDPRDVWKNYDKYKHMCAFNGRVLAGKKVNAHLKQRMTHVMVKQGDLLDQVA